MHPVSSKSVRYIERYGPFAISFFQLLKKRPVGCVEETSIRAFEAPAHPVGDVAAEHVERRGRGPARAGGGQRPARAGPGPGQAQTGAHRRTKSGIHRPS